MPEYDIELEYEAEGSYCVTAKNKEDALDEATMLLEFDIPGRLLSIRPQSIELVEGTEDETSDD